MISDQFSTKPDQQLVEISVVSTLYRSERTLDEFYRRIKATLEQLTSSYEILFVNDGSPDNSLGLALSIFHRDRNVKVLDLSRNFGHHQAILAGIKRSQGKYVFVIDCDLEEDPELLKEFWDVLHASDTDVVYGVQKRRKGGFFEQWSGFLFYFLINALSPTKIPRNILTIRLMSRRYVNDLLKFPEQDIFLAGIYMLIGYRQTPLKIQKLHKGKSTYTLLKKLDLTVRAVTSFSNWPLHATFYFGLIVTLFSLVYAGYVIWRKLVYGVSMEGWTSLIVSIWLLGGIIIFCIGLAGIYLSKIFLEVKRRPQALVRDFYAHQETPRLPDLMHHDFE